MSLLTYSLPPHLRRRAFYIGVISAFFLRAAALFSISLILYSTWIEIIGAIYLLYLSVKHFTKKKTPQAPKKHESFWKVLILIEFFDLAFAIDSIIAGVAFIESPSIKTFSGSIHPKLWIVYVGGIIGVVTIRYSADLFSRIIDRFKNLENSAHLLIAWIAIKLIVESLAPGLSGFEALFWVVFLCILTSGFLKIKLR